MSCFPVALDPTRTTRVGDAELVRVEKQRVGVSNIQLFFLSHKPVFSVGDRLDKSFTDGFCESLVLLGCELDSEIPFLFDAVQRVTVSVL